MKKKFIKDNRRDLDRGKEREKGTEGKGETKRETEGKKEKGILPFLSGGEWGSRGEQLPS